MADENNIPDPGQVASLTRAEQVLKDILEKQLNTRFKSNEEFKKLVDATTEYQKKLNEVEISLEGQLSLYSEINKQVQNFGKGLTDNIKKANLQTNTQLGLKNIYSTLNNLQGSLISNQENLLRGELSSNDVSKDILKNRLLAQNQEKLSNDLRSQQVDLTKQIDNFYNNIGANGRKLTEEETKQFKQLTSQRNAIGQIVLSLDSANTAQASITAELEKQLSNILDIEAHTGVAGKILKGFGKIPLIGDLLDINGAQKAMNIAAANGVRGFALIGKGVEALGPSLKAALGPLGLIMIAVDAFKALIGAMFDADKQVTSIAKNLSISKESAAGVRRYFIDISNTIDTTYNRLQDVIDAQLQLSNLSKFTLLFSKEAIENQIALTKEIGLSEEEAANLNKSFILNNEEGSKGRITVEKQILSLAKQTGLLANGKKILQDVSRASGQILLNFRGNLPALTDAVLQVDKLGIGLEDARSISNSLLDFESSISNELEAGVFLGRRFNLEQARALALRKDYVGATKEVLKQVGSIEEFESMSAIHQQVIAKASGMTVDALSDSLMYQKFLGIQSEANLKRLLDAGQKDVVLRAARGELAVEELDKSLRALDAQEKFNIAIDKAKEIFTNLVTGGTLDTLADVLKSIADSLASLTGQTAKVQQRRAAAEQQNAIESIRTAKPEDQANLIKQLFEQKKKSEEVIDAKPGEFKQGLFAVLSRIGSLGITSNLFGIQDKYASMSEAAESAQKDIDGLNKQLEGMGSVGKDAIKGLQDLEDADRKAAIMRYGAGPNAAAFTNTPQKVQDGISNTGPFTITDGYGKTAITTEGDKIAVSPNINTKPLVPSLDLTPMINAFNDFKNDVINVINKPQPAPTFVFEGNGAQLGKFIGSQIETGTAQNISTGYKVA